MFYRKNDEGNCVVFQDCGVIATRIEDESSIYPVSSNLSCAYEHCDGIILSVEDAETLGIECEQ